MDINRKTAYNTLYAIETRSAYSNMELNKQINIEHPTSSAFVRELVYGVLERKYTLDYILQNFLRNSSKAVKIQARILLRMGLYQIIYMDKVPEYAAINETVNMAKKLCKGNDGFINAILRNFIKSGSVIALPDQSDLMYFFSIKYNIDISILNLWKSQISTVQIEEMLIAMEQRPMLSSRINILKTTKSDLIKLLAQEGITAHETDVDNCLILQGTDVLSSDAYKEGLFSIQSIPSIIAIHQLNPQACDVIIDMCAGPGGKSVATAELMGNSGKIMAFDIYENKLKAISSQARRSGVTNIVTQISNGLILDQSLIGIADRVLCDVPCSAYGMISKKPELRYKKATSDLYKIYDLQSKILENGAIYLKNNGILLYSTCTINEYENSHVVNKFIKNNDNFMIEYEKQFYPNGSNSDGFYICRMRKTK